MVDVSTAFNGGQLQSFMQSLSTDPQASATAQLLTQRMRDGGQLQPGQRIVGVVNGRVYVSGSASGSLNNNQGSTSSGNNNNTSPQR